MELFWMFYWCVCVFNINTAFDFVLLLLFMVKIFENLMHASLVLYLWITSLAHHTVLITVVIIIICNYYNYSNLITIVL